MMKFLTAAALALCIAAQPAMAQKDAKAKTILDNVTKNVKGMKSLKANFSLSLAGAGGKVQDTKKGSFLMKGEKYHVSLSGQEIISDNKTVWTYNKEANEVQVATSDPSAQSISPSKLFTNFYDKEFAYSYAGTRTVGGKPCDIVLLTPTTKGKQFSKVELAIDKSSTIVGGSVWEKNGNVFKYEISGFTPNAPVTDAQFTFDPRKHPGVEVVDLR